MKNKVAIIIPIYNVERYLEECLDSVINQTYEDLEIILVNDGSTDSSLRICFNYLEKDDRIHIIDKKNGGLSSARNAGLDYLCKKDIKELNKVYSKKNIDDVKYIHFLDSDDYMLSNCIEFCIKKIEDCDILWHNFIIYNGNILTQFNRLGCDRFFSFNELLDFIHCIDASWCLFIRYEKFKDVRFIEGIINENIFYGTKICSMADNIKMTNKSLLVYRVRYDSISNPTSEKPYHHFLKEYFKNLSEMDYYLNIYSNLKTFKNIEDIVEERYLINYYNYLLKNKFIDFDPLLIKEELNEIHKSYGIEEPGLIITRVHIGEECYG